MDPLENVVDVHEGLVDFAGRRIGLLGEARHAERAFQDQCGYETGELRHCGRRGPYHPNLYIAKSLCVGTLQGPHDPADRATLRTDAVVHAKFHVAHETSNKLLNLFTSLTTSSGETDGAGAVWHGSEELCNRLRHGSGPPGGGRGNDTTAALATTTRLKNGS
jgi:hypothetical protein